MRLALATLLVLLALAAPAAAQDRLQRAAEGLQGSPVYVHPELTYLLPEEAQKLIVGHLRAANVPYDVKVVALPSLEADESGGDTDRALWAVDDELYKTGRLLIGVDQRGNFTLLQARLERDLDVPFEIEYGPEGDETTRTIVTRLRAVFQLAASAPERSFGYQPDRPTDPLDPLPEDRPDEPSASDDDDDDDRSPTWLILAGTGIAGSIAGALGWILSLAFRWGRRA